MESSGRRHRQDPRSLTARTLASLRSFIAGFRALAHKSSDSRELDAELLDYLEHDTQRRVLRDNLSYDEARRQARMEMGNMESIKEEVRSAGWEFTLDTIWQDIRYTVRQLRRNPVFSAVIILTLALGIGANTAIFTLLHGVMLKQLAVDRPHELYRIGDGEEFCCTWGGLQDQWGIFSYPFYRRVAANPSFRTVAAFSGSAPAFTVRTAHAGTQTITGESVSGNFFTTLGVQPFAGRLLTPADDTPSSPPAAVLGHRTWVERFGADKSIIGSTVNINENAFTIVGIAPPGFEGARLVNNPPQLWIPLNLVPLFDRAASSTLFSSGGMAWLYMLGRLQPGATPAQVDSQLTADLQSWLTSEGRRDDNQHKISNQSIHLTPGGAGISNVRRTSRRALELLTAASALVLVIACANIANLLLARGASRQHQTALRFSLGATRPRLVRAALIESTILSLIGAIAGLAVATAAARAIVLVAFRGALHVPIDANPSMPVFLFTLAIAVLTGILFGIVPAWTSTRIQPASSLRESTRSVTAHSNRPQRILVIAQTALSLILLAVAGLVTQSLRNLELADLGFEPRGRLLATVNFAAVGYRAEQTPALYDTLQQRLEAIPGVRSASLSLNSPQGNCCINLNIRIGGRPDAWIEDVNVLMNRVTPRYFETTGTPVLRGRAFTRQDTPSSRRVAVIDEAFARRFFENSDPIGQHFGLSLPGHEFDYEIIGIVREARYRNPTGQRDPGFFLPFSQTIDYQPAGYRQLENGTHYAQNIQLDVSGRPEDFDRPLRAALAELNANLAPISVRAYTEQLAIQYNQERLLAQLTGLFSLLALVLASIGLYGVTAYDVARRTSEIGVRMALGAARAEIFALILRKAVRQVAIGLALGLPLAALIARTLSRQLYGVRPFDLRVLCGAALVLITCALLAGAIPTLRATRIDPVDALRGD